MSDQQNRLQLSENFSLPRDAALWTIAVLAIKGAGKTYDSAKLAEQMILSGIPIVVLDPMGIWWGLRVGQNGEGLPIVIFGGDHADLPIPTTLSKDKKHQIIDEDKLRQATVAILQLGLSVVFDTSKLSITQQTRAVAIFGDELYRKNAPYGVRHVFIEEADEYCPQEPKGEKQESKNAIDQLVRRGGNFNIGVTMITQRPAVLNKNVLSQCGCLFVLRIMWARDKDTIRDWVKNTVKDEKEVRKLAKWYDSLKDLKNGEVWVYHPTPPEFFEKVQFGARDTLHASREYFLQETWQQKNITLRDVTQFVDKYRTRLEPKKELQKPTREIVQNQTPVQKPVEKRVVQARPGELANQTNVQPEIAIDHSEVRVQIRHAEPVLRTLSTKTGLGQIVYICVNDMEGRPASASEILKAMGEYGWTMSPNTFSPNAGRLVKEGYLVRDGDKFRPPGKVKLEVVKD